LHLESAGCYGVDINATSILLGDAAHAHDVGQRRHRGVAEGETLTLRLVPSQGRPLTFRPRVLVVRPGIMLR
jgi:hypothetical protein